MIILRNEDNEIVNLFDTAKEFKEYLDNFILEVEKEDKTTKDAFLKKSIKEETFANKLNMYLELSQNTVEIK